MNIIKKLKAFLRFREAVKRADQAHDLNKRRYYVIPTPDEKLLITDRKNFRELRRKKYISREVTLDRLREGSVYHTPDARGIGGVPAEFLQEKFREYVRWIDSSKKKEREV